MSSAFSKEQLLKSCAETVKAIRNECNSTLSSEESRKESPLAGCGLALVDLLFRQATQICAFYQELQLANAAIVNVPPEKQLLILKRLDDIISISYAKFYAFVFRDLPTCWRQLYTDASILKFSFNLLRSPYLYSHVTDSKARRSFVGENDCKLSELVKVLDLAIILAGAAGEQRGRRWVNKTLDLLYAVWRETNIPEDTLTPESPRKRTKLDQDQNTASSGSEIDTEDVFSTAEPFTPPVKHPIKRVNDISMEAFQARMDNPRDAKLGPEPLIIRGSIQNWPALTTNPWRKPSYLLSRTFDGHRLVPVEIGRSYVDEDWGQKIITFGEFLRQYIDPSLEKAQDTVGGDSTIPLSLKKSTAYLAQHPLFTQLPSLRNDILVPDYCYTAPTPHPTDPSIDQPELDEPLLNAWFGPPGTITPLHNDPYHNILAQVVGRKYVRLYSPSDTEHMQARGRENGVEMGNTSLLDVGVVEGWDDMPDDNGGQYTREGLDIFGKVLFVDCILEPGDALYIPIGWWHYVRGLSVSFSVSFWWN